VIDLYAQSRISVGPPVRHEWRTFCSILPYNDGYIGTVREYTPPHDRTSEIYALRYDRNLTIIEEVSVGIGEDPRLFYWKGHFWCLSQMFDGYNDYNNYLINLITGERTFLKVEPWIFHGKNWVPVPLEDKLLIIRSLEPLVILELGNNGICSIVQSDNSPEYLCTTYIGKRRGGTNACLVDGLITGYGHLSETLDKHTVFRYKINQLFKKVRFDSVKTVGFETNIMDPTSMWDNKVMVCATDHRWNKTQKTSHYIFSEVQ
jgi:hypothetical protein